jgi:hypothetical protein
VVVVQIPPYKPLQQSEYKLDIKIASFSLLFLKVPKVGIFSLKRKMMDNYYQQSKMKGFQNRSGSIATLLIVIHEI